ncbi:MAG TPA: hypothetical protein VF603_13010 [Allosphingosinicella sp.]
MTLGARLIAAGLAIAACAPPVAAQPPAFLTAPVTVPMLVSAVEICRSQLRAGAFDEAAMTGAGWVLAIRSEAGPPIRGYRHPDNMIILSTFAGASGADRCTVMGPTGPGLTLETMRAALRDRTAVRPRNSGGAAVWSLDDVTMTLKPMGAVGVVVELERRSADVDSRQR